MGSSIQRIAPRFVGVRSILGPLTAVMTALCLAGPLRATSVIPPNFDELVNQSDYVVRAVVRTVTPEERIVPGGSKMVFSKVELEVKQIIAGQPPSPLVLSVLGGTMGGREFAIEGAPKFQVGEESIFFVQGNGMQIYPLVRMMHGLYRIQKDSAGREYVARSNGEPLADVSQVSQPIEGAGSSIRAQGQAAAGALSPDDFVKKVKAAARAPQVRER